MRLTPGALDEYARTYYLNSEVSDIDIEERAQRSFSSGIADLLGDAQRVLDMGFGTGTMAAELLRRGVRAEVIEGSPVLVEQARARHPDLVVHEAMFESFQPSRPFDAVLALHVLEHVDAPGDLLRRVHRWLRPGGTLIVVVPNRESIHRRLAVLMGIQDRLDDLSPRDRLVGHLRVYDMDALRSDAETAGFRVADEHGFGLKCLPNAMMLDWPSELLDAMNDVGDQLPARILANIGIRAIASSA